MMFQPYLHLYSNSKLVATLHPEDMDVSSSVYRIAEKVYRTYVYRCLESNNRQAAPEEWLYGYEDGGLGVLGEACGVEL